MASGSRIAWPNARKRRLWLLLGVGVVLAALVAAVCAGNMARGIAQQSVSSAEKRWDQAKAEYADSLEQFNQQLNIAVTAREHGMSSLSKTDLVIEVAGSFAGKEEAQTFRDFQASVSHALESDTGVFIARYIATQESEVTALKVSASSPGELDSIETEIDRFGEATQDLNERARHLSDFIEQVWGAGTDRFFSEGVPAFNQSVYRTAAKRLSELDQADPERIREAQSWLDSDAGAGRLDDGIIFPVTRTVTEAAFSHLENLEVSGQGGKGLEWLRPELPTIQLALPRVKADMQSCVEIQDEQLQAGIAFTADRATNAYWLDWVPGSAPSGGDEAEWRLRTYACE